MFSNPAKPDKSFEEGTVTEVDPIRKMCKVKTLSGQNLTGVQWAPVSGGSGRGGDRVTPQLGDHVIISSSLGYPYIVAFLPKRGSDAVAFPLSIDTGDQLIDSGNFSDGGGKSVIGDPNSPPDMVVGDRIIASSGGGLLAILRGGSVVMRSSRLAEIFLSKWDNMVRVVSSNFDHYTDMSSAIIRNVKGRVYGYFGAAQTFKDGKVENYSWHQYTGDVALAEKAKTDPESVGTLPASTDVIYKEQITDGNGGTSSTYFEREIHLDGTHDVVVKSGDTFTRIKSTNNEIQVTYGDTNVIKINADEISLRKGSGPSLLLSDAGITAAFDGTEVKLDSNGFSATKSGHYIRVTSGGVAFG